MLIDTRFLKVHPRTELWWKQREQCRACHHYEKVEGCNRHGGQETCTALTSRNQNSPGLSCISAREEKRCGPNALLFKARVAA